jgi:hypothetical protein
MIVSTRAIHSPSVLRSDGTYLFSTKAELRAELPVFEHQQEARCNPRMSVCVFCGSGGGDDSQFSDTAHAHGHLIMICHAGAAN